MSKNKGNENNSWDELEDVDDFLSSSSAFTADKTGSVIKSTPEKISVKPGLLDLESSSKAEVLSIEVLNETVSKPRRRSALTEDGAASQETKVVGYSERSQRLSEQGASVDDEAGEELKVEFNRLFAKGVYLLGMREHSVQEMTDKLTARTEFVDVVLAVVDELLENNYLSNERFAQSYVRSRRNKGFGPVKIRLELKAKGIMSQLIMEHLQAQSPEWIDVAREQYEKKYRHRAQDYKEWTKRARFMQSRGFTMEHIQAVLPSADFY